MKRFVTICWTIICLGLILQDWSHLGSATLLIMLPVWVVGLIVIIIIAKAFGGGSSRGSQGMSSADTASMKTCPKCAEEVKAQAVVCRYCSYEFK